MPSPFPGMDPYLEGYLWPDVHVALAGSIRQQLTPRLRPHYVARLAISMLQDKSPEVEMGIMYPDVEVLRAKAQRTVSPPEGAFSGGPSGAGSEAAVAEKTMLITDALTLPRLNFTVRIVTVEIRDVAQNQLVTSIEILSPVNKREPGLTDYRQKRERLEAAGVHLLEIDLLRRGARPLAYYPYLPETAYLITLTRAGTDSFIVWPVALPEPLPVVAVPLREPDPDVPLDLGSALNTIYDEAAYDLSLDYGQLPPPPSFSAEETAWLTTCLEQSRQE